MLKFTIHTAVEMGAIKPAELERVIVDTTVQEKAIAHPVDSRLLETSALQGGQGRQGSGHCLEADVRGRGQGAAAQGRQLR